MAPISTAQMRMVYALSRKADIDNDLLHDMIRQQFGAESLRGLTIMQGKQLIDRLQRLAGQAPLTPQNRGSKAQVGMIYHLARELGWDDPKRLRSFLEARFHVSNPLFLTALQVTAVIEALKAMRNGGRGERRQAHDG